MAPSTPCSSAAMKSLDEQWDRLAKLAGDTPPSAVPEPRADPDRVDKDVAEALLGSFSFAASASTRAGNAADISEAQRNGNVPNPSSSSSSSFGNGNASAQISDLLAARMELEDVRATAEAVRGSTQLAIAAAKQKTRREREKSADASARADEDRNKIQAAFANLRQREQTLLAKEHDFADREREIPSLLQLRQKLQAREDDALVAEDAATEAAKTAREQIEKLQDEKAACDASLRESQKAIEIAQGERRKTAKDFELLEHRRLSILDELFSREKACRETVHEIALEIEHNTQTNKRLLSERAAIEDALEITKKKRADEQEVLKRYDAACVATAEAEDARRRALEAQKMAEKKLLAETQKVSATKAEFEAALVESEKLQSENQTNREKFKQAISELRKELETERETHTAQLEETRKTQATRLEDLEESFRRKRDDWEVERRYEREEVHRMKTQVEDEAAVARREKENANELVRRVEAELVASRDEEKRRRDTESDLAARTAAVTEREQTMGQWRDGVKHETQKTGDEREKILKEWEDRVRLERDESRALGVKIKQEREQSRQDLELVHVKTRAAQHAAEEAKEKEEASRRVAEGTQRKKADLFSRMEKFEGEKRQCDAEVSKAAATEAECAVRLAGMTRELELERDRIKTKEEQLQRDLTRCARVEKDAEATMKDARRQRDEAHATLSEANAARAEIEVTAVAVERARTDAHNRLQEAEGIRENVEIEAQAWSEQRDADSAALSDAREEVENARAEVELLVNATNAAREAASAELTAAKLATDGLDALEQALEEREGKVNDAWRLVRADAESSSSKKAESSQNLVNKKGQLNGVSGVGYDYIDDADVLSPTDFEAALALREAIELLGGLEGSSQELGLATSGDSLEDDARLAAEALAGTSSSQNDPQALHSLSLTPHMSNALVVDGNTMDAMGAVDSVRSRLEASLRAVHAKLLTITKKETLLQTWAVRLQRERNRHRESVDATKLASQKIALAVTKTDHARRVRHLEYKRRDDAIAETEASLRAQRAELATVVEKIQQREADVGEREETVFDAGRAVAVAEQVMHKKMKDLGDADAALVSLRRDAAEAEAAVSRAVHARETFYNTLKELEAAVEKARIRLQDATAAAEDAEAVFEHKATLCEKQFGDRAKVAELRCHERIAVANATARQLEETVSSKEAETKKQHDQLMQTARNETNRLKEETDAKCAAIEHAAATRLRKAETAERRLETDLAAMKEFQSAKENQLVEIKTERAEIRRLSQEVFAEQSKARDLMAAVEEERLMLKTEERNTRSKCDAAIEKAREEGKQAEVREMKAVAAEAAAAKQIDGVRATRAECDTLSRAAAEAQRFADAKVLEAERALSQSKLLTETISVREKTCAARSADAEHTMRRAEKLSEEVARSQADLRDADRVMREAVAATAKVEKEKASVRADKVCVSTNENRLAALELDLTLREEKLTVLEAKKQDLLQSVDTTKLALVAAESKLREAELQTEAVSKTLAAREEELVAREKILDDETEKMSTKLETERLAMKAEVDKLEFQINADRELLIQETNDAQVGLDNAREAAARARALEDTEAERKYAELLEKAEGEKHALLESARAERDAAVTANQAAVTALGLAETRFAEAEAVKREMVASRESVTQQKEAVSALEEELKFANEALAREKTVLQKNARDADRKTETALAEARVCFAKLADITAREEQCADLQGVLHARMQVLTTREENSAKQAAAVAEAEVRVNILSDELTLEKASLAQKMESTKARLDALAKREAAAAIAETEALVYAKKAAADRLATAAARDAAEKLSAQLKGDAGQAASAMFAAERSWKQKETKTVAREQELRSAVARAEAEEVRLKEELCKIEATRSEIAGQTATLKEEKVSLEADKKSARAASANAESRTREADEKQESALRTQSEASAKLDAATEAIAKLNLLKVTLDADAEAVHRQRRDFEASVAVAEKSKAAALNETDRFQKEVNVLKHERDAVSTELKLLERQRGEAERVVARGKEISSENAEVKLKVTKLEAFESSLRTKEQQIAAAAATLTRQSLQIDSQKAEVERSKQDARRIARLAAETQARREREWASAVLIEKAQLEHVKKSALVDTKEVTSLRETLAKERKAWSEERGCFESERQNVRAEFEARLARVSAEQEQTRHTAISQEEEASARKRRDDALFGLEKARDEALSALQQVQTLASSAAKAAADMGRGFGNTQSGMSSGPSAGPKGEERVPSTYAKRTKAVSGSLPNSTAKLPPRRLLLVTPASSPGGVSAAGAVNSKAMSIQSVDDATQSFGSEQVSSHKKALRERLLEAERKLRRAEHLGAGFLFANAGVGDFKNQIESLRRRLAVVTSACDSSSTQREFEVNALDVAGWFGELQTVLVGLFETKSGKSVRDSTNKPRTNPAANRGGAHSAGPSPFSRVEF